MVQPALAQFRPQFSAVRTRPHLAHVRILERADDHRACWATAPGHPHPHHPRWRSVVEHGRRLGTKPARIQRMTYDNQRPPYWMRARSNPVAVYVTPTTDQRSDRALAGPLRMGTSRGVGPRGLLAPDSFGSDLGVDRVSPRRFDPMGTSLQRAPLPENSTLISREVRRPIRREG